MVNDRLSVLYKEWQQNYPGNFVTGGVIEESKYKESDVKILFLLKEMNDSKKQEDHSLIQLIHNQINSLKFKRIWEIIGLWIYGLQQGFPPYKKLIPRHSAGIQAGLLSIAVTTLKKTIGGGQSSLEEVKKHAKFNKNLWTKEIGIMNPDIVICSGTFSIVQKLLGFDVAESNSGANIGKYENRLFVDFNHPVYRISPKLFYAYFKETMQTMKV